jgi:regulator of RNase E activity RraA
LFQVLDPFAGRALSSPHEAASAAAPLQYPNRRKTLSSPPYPISGDAGVGSLQPPRTHPAEFQRLDPAALERLRNLTGVSATASDVLDELGLALALPASLIPLRTAPKLVVGQALTVRYLPERRSGSHPELRVSPSRMAHHTVFALAQPGDVVVVEGCGTPDVSLLGGMAASSAVRAGVAACVVDGGIRDVEQVRSSGLSVWSRSVTPRTGKWRVEAVAINEPIACGAVQVHPGDLVIADETGICFFPVEVSARAIERLVEVGAEEEQAVGSAGADHARR